MPRARGQEFVGGPTLNVYNLRTLKMLMVDGLRRLALGVELGSEQLAELRDAAAAENLELPEVELIAWGRLPLAYSARCFTARALNLGKDDCAFRCIEHPDGLKLSTRDGTEFLIINGVQVQSFEVCDVGEAQMLWAAVLMCRIISKPAPGLITVDLGHKSVAAENPLPNRIHFLNLRDYEPVGQSEEHLVLKVSTADLPVGDILYGIPYHVCPSVALYDQAAIIREHRWEDTWEVKARSRKINF